MLKSGNSLFSHNDNPQIYYDYSPHGSSFCLVFLHGLGGNTTAFKHIRNHFHQQGVSTLAIDLLGHGRSHRPNDPDLYTMSSQAEIITPLINKLPQKKIILVGHCFGAMVSLTIVAKHPKLCKALVLIDTSYKLPQPIRNFFRRPPMSTLISLLYRRLPNLHLPQEVDYSEFVGTSDWDIRRITSDVLHTSIKSYLSACQALLGYDATKLLSKISIPTLVIVGKNDSIFPPPVSNTIHQRLKNSFFELIPNANHIIVINQPKAVSNSIDHFLHSLKLL